MSEMGCKDRGYSVANHLVTGPLAPSKPEVVGESLKAGRLANGKRSCLLRIKVNVTKSILVKMRGYQVAWLVRPKHVVLVDIRHLTGKLGV